ncbi:urocanate hydratase [Rufibacter immobilis]|uniref:Urocanate hydratase n=1 Tax=Rufibacter immobilis TaxID=1348778 RepID=A0A3M9MSH1_9BACT|nr:urocanate hydratase [Rufibacter immobilis]RNI28474.1 urocanate hydratase [Rufibacter immobilis]
MQNSSLSALAQPDAASAIEDFVQTYAAHPVYIPPRGPRLHAKNWPAEAALRMFLNNLSNDVAEKPEELVVYGGIGQAARTPQDARKIVELLLTLEEDESLLIQSGKPVGKIRSHAEAPRVLIANSNLVPRWSTWEHFNQLRERGLMMYGQMTAGSWIYIGTQGILQGTYETFAACGRRHYNGDLRHKLVVSGGLGGMGGAQPLAATMAGATFLGVDIDPERIKKRVETGYLDHISYDYHHAMRLVLAARHKGEAVSIGLVGNIGDVLEKLLEDEIIPDILTDQTSAHDPINGYVPHGLTLEEALALRQSDPQEYKARSLQSMARHVGYMLEMQRRGSCTFDYGNNLREYAQQGGEANAFQIPGFVPEYIRPLFCEGKGPFRWVALSGDPEDIKVTDEALKQLFPENTHMIGWLNEASLKVSFQGLPSRICWLGMGEREKAGLLFNQLVREGKVKAPLVIGRDHLDCGSVASPYRETEGMKDGSDAVSDWPLLNLMANASGGATWISFHHGGGVGMGFSQHAGMVIVADGSERADRCLRRVLHNDPALGIFRHADAGYETAQQNAVKHGLTI